MRLTVLGCNGPFPEAGGACSGYLLEDGGDKILLDCGSGVLPYLTALIGMEKLSAVVLTHLHYDHMSDMLPLIYRCQMKGVKLPVYLPMQPSPVLDLLNVPAFELHDIAQGGCIGEISFTAFQGRHPVPSYAVRLQNAKGRVLCYTGDTNTAAGLDAFARGCDLMLADGCFTREGWREELPHMSAYLAAGLADKAHAKRLLITHFHPDIPKDILLRQAQEAFSQARLAEPGLRTEV